MAGFKTHITVSTLMGVGYGTVAYAKYGVPLSTSVLAGGLCSVSGMLPDIDSDSGVPLRESLAFAAAVVPMMLVGRFRQLGWSNEAIILAGAITYLLIRFALAALLKKYTVHRGMFHSIPAAIIFGELAYLLFGSEEPRLRVFLAAAVAMGYFTHLALDELWAFKIVRGRVQMKSSFGTALKLIGENWWANGTTYAKLAILTFLVFKDPTCLTDYRPGQVEQSAWRAIETRLGLRDSSPSPSDANSPRTDSSGRWR